MAGWSAAAAWEWAGASHSLTCPPVSLYHGVMALCSSSSLPSLIHCHRLHSLLGMSLEEPRTSAPSLPSTTSTQPISHGGICSPGPSTPSTPSIPTPLPGPSPPPSSPFPLPSRVLFPNAPYPSLLDGCSVLLPPLSRPSSPPHDVLQRQYGAQTADGRCRLTLCEAFFLLHALQALTVTDGEGRPLTGEQLLSRCCEADGRFLSLFAVYAHWTALGWVVRQGSKMGVDFLLYPYRPLTTRTHSTSTTTTPPHLTHSTSHPASRHRIH